MKKILFGLLFATLLGIVTLSNVKQLEANGTIYIRADGSIDPLDGRVITDDKVHYNFTQDIHDSIVVERNDIIIDGANDTIEGIGTGVGVDLSNRVNVTIRNMRIRVFATGILLKGSALCTISGTNITANLQYGICLSGGARNNTISGNRIGTSSESCIDVSYSSANKILGNTIDSLNNAFSGVRLAYDGTTNNYVSGNAIANNTRGIFVYSIRSSYTVLSGNIISNNAEDGVDIAGSSIVDVSGNIVNHSKVGISLWGGSSNTNVYGNILTDNGRGIEFQHDPANCNLYDNTITDSERGIFVSGSNLNLTDNFVANCSLQGVSFGGTRINLHGNVIIRNNYGIELNARESILDGNSIAYNNYGSYISELATSNLIFHNNFLYNEVQAVGNASNSWDAGYPSGGNYWSDYEGIDQDGDGIGDTETPHNKDRYPFIVPIGPIPVLWRQESHNCLISGKNVTVSQFAFEQNRTITFRTIGQGYVNLTIPREYADGFFKVFVNDTQVPYMSSCDNTCISIYFESKTSSSSIVRIEAQMKFLGDINGDGAVNIIDIFIVAKHFGQKLNP